MTTITNKMSRSPYGLEADRPAPWWTRAACRGHDPELWSHLRSWRSLPGPNRPVQHLTLHRSEARALAICATCPVQADCYLDALTASPRTVGVIRAGLFWPQPPTTVEGVP